MRDLLEHNQMQLLSQSRWPWAATRRPERPRRPKKVAQSRVAMAGDAIDGDPDWPLEACFAPADVRFARALGGDESEEEEQEARRWLEDRGLTEKDTVPITELERELEASREAASEELRRAAAVLPRQPEEPAVMTYRVDLDSESDEEPIGGWPAQEVNASDADSEETRQAMVLFFIVALFLACQMPKISLNLWEFIFFK